jgi:predicted esterase
MLGLYKELGVEGVAGVLPEAAGRTWYPQSFLAPLEANQPWLDSALEFLELVVAEVLARGVPSRRVGLLGFSQGACLALEYTARHPRRYGAVVGLTGGLIGPPEMPRQYAGSLEGTPIFLGSGDPDPHVPFARVEETLEVLEKMGGVVEMRRYPGLPHGINEEEMEVTRGMVERMTAVSEVT